MMDILLIAGHGAGDPGAVATVKGVKYQEYNETRIVVEKLESLLKQRGANAVVYDTTRNAYSDYQSGKLATQAQFYKYDFVLEVHFNAFQLDATGDGQKRGVEIYRADTAQKSGYEDKILSAISGFGLPNRGVKAGAFAVIRTAARSCAANLLEVCFIDDADDMAIYLKNRDAICEKIADAICPEEEKTTVSNLQRYGVKLSDVEHIGYIAPPSGLETLTDAAKRAVWQGRPPDVVFNAELFNADGTAASGIVHDGVADLLPEAHGVAFKDECTPTLSYKNNVNAPLWVGAYPLLVRDGEVTVDSVPAGLGGTRARTAIAWNSQSLAMCACQAASGMELAEFAQAILDAGFTFAVNLDGGGSTAYATPLAAYEQGRRTRGKIGIWMKGGTGNWYKKTETPTAATGTSTAQDGAMQQDKTKAKGERLTVSARTGLNLRRYPEGAILKVLPSGSTVMWYGYYCVKNGDKWLYIRAGDGTQGYAAAEYLKA